MSIQNKEKLRPEPPRIYTIVKTGADANHGEFPDPLALGSFFTRKRARQELNRLVEAEKSRLSPRYDAVKEDENSWEAYEDGYGASRFSRIEVLTSELQCSKSLSQIPVGENAPALSARQFYQIMSGEIGGCSRAVVAMWVNFAVECVEDGQYVDFTSSGDEAIDMRHWLGFVCVALLNAKANYGAEAASQVCLLALRPTCLYPWEMQPAARYWKEHGSLENVLELQDAGVFEDDEQTYLPLSKLIDLSKYGAAEP